MTALATRPARRLAEPAGMRSPSRRLQARAAQFRTMLFKARVLAGLADGSVTLAFRRWRTPRVRQDSRMRTAAGVIGVAGISPTTIASISEADARRAGFPSRADLLRELGESGSGQLYRIRLRWLGPDTREGLRRQTILTAGELAALRQRLTRLDAASPNGPWTRHTLRLIRDRPGVRASELAHALHEDTARLKRNVRTLKELGLTESLEVGYRLSPRGRVALRALRN